MPEDARTDHARQPVVRLSEAFASATNDSAPAPVRERNTKKWVKLRSSMS